MEKKTIQKTTVLKYSLTTTLANIMTDPGDVPNEIMNKAMEPGLGVAGPQVWAYRGVDGKPDTPFQLEICQPIVEAKGDAGKFVFCELPEMTCITEIHKGPWKKLGETYGRIFGEMGRKGIIPTGVSREVYHTCDFENEANNVTEIQIEIQQ